MAEKITEFITTPGGAMVTVLVMFQIFVYLSIWVDSKFRLNKPTAVIATLVVLFVMNIGFAGLNFVLGRWYPDMSEIARLVISIGLPIIVVILLIIYFRFLLAQPKSYIEYENEDIERIPDDFYFASKRKERLRKRQQRKS